MFVLWQLNLQIFPIVASLWQVEQSHVGVQIYVSRELEEDTSHAETKQIETAECKSVSKNNK